MKKLSLLLLAPLLLGGCKHTTFGVVDYTYAYQTSEVQEYTHDIYLAHCKGDIYVEIPENYYSTTIDLKKTNKMIYYYVYGVDHKVSNKGWEYLKK